MVLKILRTDCVLVVCTYFLSIVFPMSVNKCSSNTENMKICFASNKSFSALLGVQSGSNTCSHSCDLAVMYKRLLKPTKNLSYLSVGYADSSLLIPFLKLTNF